MTSDRNALLFLDKLLRLVSVVGLSMVRLTEVVVCKDTAGLPLNPLYAPQHIHCQGDGRRQGLAKDENDGRNGAFSDHVRLRVASIASLTMHSGVLFHRLLCCRRDLVSLWT